MAIPKRTEITIETEKVTIIRTRRAGDYIFCPRCSVLSLPLTIAEAVTAIGLTDAEIASRIDRGVFHSIEHGGRTLKICGNSLSEAEELHRDTKTLDKSTEEK